MPPGFNIVERPPTAAKLDPFNDESDSLALASSHALSSLAGVAVSILRKNTNCQRKINGELVNFFAKFDIDEGETDLSLDTVV